MFKDLEDLARADVDPDFKWPDPTAFEFGGFAWPYDDANLIELWHQWEEHGVMPEPGGYFDQPPEWHEAIYWCRRIYNWYKHEVKEEVERRRLPDHA